MASATSLWLIWLGHAILSNVVVASLLSIIATVVGWRLRSPALAHGLWVLVLIKLITPPIVHVPVFIPNWLSITQYSEITSPVIQTSNKSDAKLPTVADSLIERGAVTKTAGLDLDAGSFTLLSGWLSVILVVLLFTCLVIAALRMCRSLIRSIRFLHLLEAKGSEYAEATELGQQMAIASNLATAPRIRLVSANLSPMLFGFSRWATIVIPEGLWNELNTWQKRAMLAHELSHYRRCDHWVRGLELITGSLFFWLPLVRIARAQIERMEETCCDLNAVHALENDRRLYAESLLLVVDYISQRGGRMPAFASGMGPTITLEERLRSIMNEKATGRMSDRNRSFLSIFGLVVLLIHPLASASPSSGRTMNPTMEANRAVGIMSPDKLVEKETKREIESRSDSWFVPLPEVPHGWWNDKKYDNAVRSLRSSDSSAHAKELLFNPGISIDVFFRDGSAHRLAERTPTAIIALHNASRLIVGNSQGDIRMWDVDSQQSVSWIGRHEVPVTTLCYHPKFGLLSGDANGSVLQWEIQSGAIQNSWSGRGSIQSIRCNADGEHVALVFGEWKNHVEHSNLVFISPSKWAVTGTIDVPIALATIFDRAGSWHAVDWNGYVYQFPFQQKTGRLPKADVTAITFSQDVEIPSLQRIPIEILSLPFNVDAPEL